MPQNTYTGDGLKRAMATAKLRDVDVAARLKVDPKTVQRWLSGRLPQTRHRWALADLLGAGEFDLWPYLSGASDVATEVKATYPCRSAVPRDVWLRLFQHADHQIDVLVYAGLFLAEDAQIVQAITRRAAQGVKVRLLLGDPDSQQVADRGDEEGIGSAMAAKVRNALVLYRDLAILPGVEIRLHRTVLHNSLYRADGELMVNQHVYGLAAAFAPVLHLRQEGESEIFSTYMASFARVWEGASPLAVPA